MEHNDWMQFVSPSLQDTPEPSTPCEHDRPVAEKTQAQLPTLMQSNPALLTPPESSHGSPTDEPDEHTFVSVSTTFFPGANLANHSPDLVLLTSDTVFFYVHAARILSASNNRFDSLVPEEIARAVAEQSSPASTAKDKDDVGPVIPVSEHSALLNIALHAIYGISCMLYSPSASALVAAVDTLAKYGVDLHKYVAPSTLFFQHLLAQSATSPMEVYACAAQHGLQELCVQVSPHLLAFPLCNITDEDATKMGPVHLKRVFFQHLGRVDALKRLLLPPPSGHIPTRECGLHEQKKLTRAWALASAYLAWDARPDLSTVVIESALGPLGEHLTCEMCRSALHERIKQLIVQWALVKRTI